MYIRGIPEATKIIFSHTDVPKMLAQETAIWQKRSHAICLPPVALHRGR